MRRPAFQLYVGIAAFDVTTQRNALLVVNAVMRSLKLTARSRAVQIWTTKIGFNPAADSIPIYQDWIRSEFSTPIGSNLTNYLIYKTTILVK